MTTHKLSSHLEGLSDEHLKISSFQLTIATSSSLEHQAIVKNSVCDDVPYKGTYVTFTFNLIVPRVRIKVFCSTQLRPLLH